MLEFILVRRCWSFVAFIDDQIYQETVVSEAQQLSQLVKINVLSKEVTCSAKDVDVVVAAKKALATFKLSEKEIMTFRMECIKSTDSYCIQLCLVAVW